MSEEMDKEKYLDDPEKTVLLLKSLKMNIAFMEKSEKKLKEIMEKDTLEDGLLSEDARREYREYINMIHQAYALERRQLTDGHEKISIDVHIGDFIEEEAVGEDYSEQELNAFLMIEPSDVVDIRLMTTKLTQSLITTPMHEILASQLAINVASKTDKDNGNDVLTYFEILEHPSIKLPENFEFTEKTARYIDAIGSALENPSVRENGGVIKVRHLINIMNGKNASNVKEEEIENVIRDLDLLSSVNIYFDTTEHADYDKKRKSKKNWIGRANRDYLLPTGLRIGDDGEAYILIKDVPPLYRYAQDTGHIATYKKSDLDLTRVYVTNEDGIVVKELKTPITRQTMRDNNIAGLFLRTFIPQLSNLKKKAGKGKRPYVEVTYQYIYDYLVKLEPDLNIEQRKSATNKRIYNVLEVLKMNGNIDNFDAEIPKGRIRKHKIRIY